MTWLKLQECKQFSWFWNTQQICIWNSSVFQMSLLEKDMISFQIEARHLHIAPKWLFQPEIGYTTLHFFKSTHPLSHWLCIVHQKWWENMKNKVIQHNIYIFISISISGGYRLWHCTIYVKCQGWDTICWGNWGTKTTN